MRSSGQSWSACVRNCTFRVTLMLPKSAGVLIVTRSSIVSSPAGRAESLQTVLVTGEAITRMVPIEIIDSPSKPV